MRGPVRIRDGLLTLLVSLALLVVITVLAPDPATDVRRRWIDVDVGQWAVLDRASVRVSGVRLTRSIKEAYGDDFTSAVTLVLVDVEAAVRRDQMHFSQVQLRTADDRLYNPRSEFLSEGLSLTQPGFTRRGTLVFEVPDSRVAAAVLVIEPDGAAYDVYSTAARVGLGLRASDPVEAGPAPISISVVEVTR